MKYLSGLFSACLCMVVLVLFGVAGCKREPQKAEVKPAAVKSEVVSATTLLATISDDERPEPPSGGIGHGSAPVVKDQPALYIIQFNQYGTGVAYMATVGDRIRVVLNGKPGKLYDSIDAYTFTLSPDGQRVAYGARSDKKWFAVVDEKEYGPFVQRGRLSFSPDSRHVAYEAQVGEKWYMFVDSNRDAGAVSYYDKAIFSSDSSRVMYLENTDRDSVFRLVVSDLDLRRKSVREVGSPLIAVSSDNTQIAAVEKKNNKQRVVRFTFENPAAADGGAWYDEIKSAVFSDDGKALAYLAKRGGKTLLVLNGKEEIIPDGEYPWPPVIWPDNESVGLAVVVGKDGAYLHRAFYNGGNNEGRYKEIADLAHSRDGRLHAYVAIKNERFLIVVNGKEGPTFDRVISPQFSPDGKYLVYRARKGDKRFVVAADPKGKILKQYEGYERVFQPVFTADGRSIAYGVIDGKKLLWKVDPLP